MNTLFRIAFGDYEFILDRTSLTYSLTETVTKTMWATELSLGWIELKDRETGAISRTDFGDCKLISIAEKMGAAGKRILLGLDAPGGVPIDIYLICGSKDIQLIVEASRDSKTHTLEKIGLLPELASVGTENEYLFWPNVDELIGDEYLFWSEDFSPDQLDFLRISGGVWQTLGMPFFGAVRQKSALALLTDSAYAQAAVSSLETRMAFSWEYRRDPERRRLDIRIVSLPQGDAVAICKAYRDKLVAERHHRTLRMRMRERPQLESLLGAVMVQINDSTPPTIPSEAELLGFMATYQELLSHHNVIVWLPESSSPLDEQELHFISMCKEIGWQVGTTATIGTSYIPVPKYFIRIQDPRLVSGKAAGLEIVRAGSRGLVPQGLIERENHRRWDEMELQLDEIQTLQNSFPLVGGNAHDWSASAVDFCGWGRASLAHAVVWRDALVTFAPRIIISRGHIYPPHAFARLLLFLGGLMLTAGFDLQPDVDKELVAAMLAIACPLHRLTFAAFLKSHHFLTPDRKVQEAVYTDSTRVVVNLRFHDEESPYETDELLLPPGGFYVRHPQFEAHDALRVRTVEFPQRAWRVRRSLDGKPLEQSEQIEEREFLVVPPPGGG